MAYRLRAGDTGPVQQSPVTCGSACLTVARMLVDPLFASWIRTGQPAPPGSPGGATEAERFAAYERVVMRRTNGIFAGGRPADVPWPRRLGHPPVGGAARARAGRGPARHAYTLDVLRPADEAELVGAFDTLVDVVAEGEPALLYVGNALSPRHVVLVLPGRRRPDARRLRPGRRAGSATCGATPWCSDGWGSVAGTSRGSPCGPRGCARCAPGLRPGPRCGRRPGSGARLTQAQAVGLATGTSSTSRAPTSSPAA